VVLAPDDAAGGAASGTAANGTVASGAAARGTAASGTGARRVMARRNAAGRRAAVAETWSGTFTLTASGGPVSFSVRAPAPFTVSPARGMVLPGQPVTVTVSVTAGARVPFLARLTVRPGGLSVLVEFPPAKAPPSSPPPSQPPSSSPPPSSGPPPPSDSAQTRPSDGESRVTAQAE
jgi:hypothetical protein